MANDNMVKLMQISMDDLEKIIKTRRESLQFAEDVFALRNKAGEYSSKQLERKQKRAAKKAQTKEPETPPVSQM